jgi:hypothetical protein
MGEPAMAWYKSRTFRPDTLGMGLGTFCVIFSRRSSVYFADCGSRPRPSVSALLAAARGRSIGITGASVAEYARWASRLIRIFVPARIISSPRNASRNTGPVRQPSSARSQSASPGRVRHR